MTSRKLNRKPGRDLRWNSPDYPRKGVDIERGKDDDESGRKMAAALTGPAVAAMRVIRAAEAKSGIDEALDIPTLLEHLRSEAQAVRDGSLATAEGMLANQAIALQSLFARLTERAMSYDTAPGFEVNMRYALRAQSQCRQTLETLALVKQGPAVFARSANVVNGPQQVNVGTTPQAPRAGENRSSLQPEVLESNDGEWLDSRAEGKAGGSNTTVEAVGAKHGS